MRAELIIRHRGGLGHDLPAILGVNDAAVLGRTLLLAQVPEAQDVWSYATEGATYRAVGWEATPSELHLFVEPTIGDLRSVCQTIWSGIRSYAGGRSPELESMLLVDDSTGRPIATGRTGFAPHFARRELAAVLITAATSGLWLLVAVPLFAADADIVLGAIPGLLAGIVALMLIVIDARRQRVVWS